MIIATDSFGAETEVTEFNVAVNRPPVVIHDRQDVVLYRDEGCRDAIEAIGLRFQTGTPNGVTYTLSRYFDDLDFAVEVPHVVNGEPRGDRGDTTCVFSTSPKQPTGRVIVADRGGRPQIRP